MPPPFCIHNIGWCFICPSKCFSRSVIWIELVIKSTQPELNESLSLASAAQRHLERRYVGLFRRPTGSILAGLIRSVTTTALLFEHGNVLSGSKCKAEIDSDDPGTHMTNIANSKGHLSTSWKIASISLSCFEPRPTGVSGRVVSSDSRCSFKRRTASSTFFNPFCTR